MVIKTYTGPPISVGYRSRGGILVVLEPEQNEVSKTSFILIWRPITVLYLATLFLQSRRNPQNKNVVFLGPKLYCWSWRLWNWWNATQTCEDSAGEQPQAKIKLCRWIMCGCFLHTRLAVFLYCSSADHKDWNYAAGVRTLLYYRILRK